MTTEEFSNEFDILLNSYIQQRDSTVGQTVAELDEYEKSVLLTKAQEEIVKGLYNGTLGAGFEATEEMRRSLDALIITLVLNPIDTTKEGMSASSKFFQLPKDVWYITYEVASLIDDSLKCSSARTADIIPVRQDEYHNIINNPFRGPNENRVLRIDSGESIVELISKYNIAQYYLKYLKRPYPIILVNLQSDGMFIDNEQIPKGCELNTILHRPILERAVSLAIKRMPQKNV